MKTRHYRTLRMVLLLALWFVSGSVSLAGDDKDKEGLPESTVRLLDRYRRAQTAGNARALWWEAFEWRDRFLWWPAERAERYAALGDAVKAIGPPKGGNEEDNYQYRWLIEECSELARKFRRLDLPPESYAGPLLKSPSDKTYSEFKEHVDSRTSHLGWLRAMAILKGDGAFAEKAVRDSIDTLLAARDTM